MELTCDSKKLKIVVFLHGLEKNNDLEALVAWGGGKDSTVALLLASCYVKNKYLKKLHILTFENYLASKSVSENRSSIIQCLKDEGINYVWKIDAFGGRSNVYKIYEQVLRKTGIPRSICLICNIMAALSETRVINENKIKYLISGNTKGDFKALGEWETMLAQDKKTGNPVYDSMYSWRKKYREWLDYFEIDHDAFDVRLPEMTDPVMACQHLSLLNHHTEFALPENRISYIEQYGWRLPPAEEGVIGTETDCILPSVIYGLSLLQDRDYVSRLKELENKNFMPKDILYRGTEDTTNIMNITGNFLKEVGITEQEWKHISSENLDMPASLRKYLLEFLLPVR